MAASRAARKREMIANLESEEYLNDLANESYAIIFTQSTTNTVAQKKVKKAFEAGGCHIGAKDKHVSWKAGNGDFQTVDAFLESDNSARCSRDSTARFGRSRTCSLLFGADLLGQEASLYQGIQDAHTAQSHRVSGASVDAHGHDAYEQTR